MSGDESESSAHFQKLSVIEFILQGVDVVDKHRLIFLGPFVLNFDFLILVHDERLIK